ncbi:TetR family transcriptional regulator [Nocardia sp. NBC_01377]|uniref:TetR family transcriptional regulator n=1 Tax=Nocardia sp. NBC_01377 TaxID=2903595 RepID=UPI00324D1D70
MVSPAAGKRSSENVSLRERHKVRTRAAIRSAAMRLFAEHGYGRTTVEQIARAAEVSHTTFFRYFQTKEQVVISDDLDSARAAVLEALPADLGHFELLRRLITEGYHLSLADEWASDPERMRLIRSEPALRLAYQLYSERAISDAAQFFADYTGHGTDDLELRVFVGVIGGIMFNLAQAVEDPRDEKTLSDLLSAVDLVERGLPL